MVEAILTAEFDTVCTVVQWVTGFVATAGAWLLYDTWNWEISV